MVFLFVVGFPGVYTITMDGEEGMVTVSGDIDPPILIKKLKKIGKHAELWPPSEGGNHDQPNKEEAQAMQTEDGQNGKPKKGGKAQGGQQPQPSQVAGMEELKKPLLKDKNLPSKNQVPSVNLGGGDGDGDGWGDEISDIGSMNEDGLADESDEEVAPQGQQEQPMAAPVSGGANGNKAGGNAKSKGMGGNNNPTNGKGGNKGTGGNTGGGNKNPDGGNGVAKNGGPQQAADAGGNNKGPTSGTGAAGIKSAMGPEKAQGTAHGFNGMPGGGVNMGQMMGNIPLPPMPKIPLPPLGNIPPVPGPMPAGPELNMAGNYFQWASLPASTAISYCPPHPATMMIQQPPPPQYGRYARPLKPMPYMPQPSLGELNMHYFSEEETNGCSIM